MVRWLKNNGWLLLVLLGIVTVIAVISIAMIKSNVDASTELSKAEADDPEETFTATVEFRDSAGGYGNYIYGRCLPPYQSIRANLYLVDAAEQTGAEYFGALPFDVTFEPTGNRDHLKLSLNQFSQVTGIEEIMLTAGEPYSRTFTVELGRERYTSSPIEFATFTETQETQNGLEYCVEIRPQSRGVVFTRVRG